jgi:hypothetical protein
MRPTVIKDDHMPAEPEAKPGAIPAIAAAVALPLLYVLSWGPVGALAQRWQFGCTPLEIVYYPIRWSAFNCPGAYEPLKWYWERFDFLRPDPSYRARDLIYASEPCRDEAEAPPPNSAPDPEVADSEDEQSIRCGEYPGSAADEAGVGFRGGDDALDTRELINTSENLRLAPEIWEKSWFLDSPASEQTEMTSPTPSMKARANEEGRKTEKARAEK